MLSFASKKLTFPICECSVIYLQNMHVTILQKLDQLTSLGVHFVAHCETKIAVRISAFLSKYKT